MTHLVIRDDEVQRMLVAGHQDAVAQLVDTLTSMSVQVEAAVRPARFNAPIASGTFETIAISVSSGVIGAVLTDIRQAVARCAIDRHRERLKAPSPHAQTVTEYTLCGSDGEIIGHWLARGDEIPDGD